MYQVAQVTDRERGLALQSPAERHPGQLGIGVIEQKGIWGWQEDLAASPAEDRDLEAGTAPGEKGSCHPPQAGHTAGAELVRVDSNGHLGIRSAGPQRAGRWPRVLGAQEMGAQAHDLCVHSCDPGCEHQLETA